MAAKGVNSKCYRIYSNERRIQDKKLISAALEYAPRS